MKWADVPATTTIKLARERQADLGRLTWDASERRADDVTVRLALRRGISCTLGLVIDGGDIFMQDQPANLVRTHAKSKQSLEKMLESPTTALLERVIPGNTAEWHRLIGEVDKGAAKALEDAVDELREALASEPQQTLVDHWTRLGGVLPSPV